MAVSPLHRSRWRRFVASALVAVSAAVAAVLLTSGPAGGASPGEVAIIGVRADDVDAVSGNGNDDAFVWVPLVDLAGGAELVFTDAGWTAGGTFRPGEGAIRYTAPAGGLAAGTVMVLEFSPKILAGGAYVFTPSGGGGTYTDADDAIVGMAGLQTAVTGDQLFVLEGSTASPSFLWGWKNEGDWDADATSNDTSALPGGLTAGVDAVAVGGGESVDNAWYTGPRTGAPAEVAEAIADPANWTTDNDVPPPDLGGADFAVDGTPPPPTEPPTGYWLLELDGDVTPFGEVPELGGIKADLPSGASAVAIEARPQGDGYWVLSSDGDLHARGAALDFGSVDLTTLTKTDERVATMSSNPAGDGLWVFTTAGRILAFGTARPGDQLAGSSAVLALDLDGPIVDSVATATGLGVYMVASDGGVFAIGDAVFIDSVRGALTAINGPPGLPDQPVVGVVADPDGDGYWMVAADGGVFSFRAPFRGSLPALVPFDQLAEPVNGMVPFGDGYILVADDGGVFVFSDLAFAGSGAGLLDTDVVDIAAPAV